MGPESALLCLLLFQILTKATPDQSTLMVQSNRVQELHACVGTSAYIPWPLNIMTRKGHKATVITLTFQRRHSQRKIVVASYGTSSQLVASDPFKGRLKMSGEHSGTFLKRVGFDDDGVFTAQARSSKGRVWTRTTNLTVHVRPMVKGDQLIVSKSELFSPDGAPASPLHCTKLTCGLLEYAGYPPTQYIWQATNKVLAMETATDDSVSTLELCGPFSDHVTCSIAGFSSTCTYDYVVSIHIDLPAPATNTSQVTHAGVSSDLVLMVVVPILAVGIPLVVLGVWMLSHLMGDRRRRRYNRELRATKHVEHTLSNGGVVRLRSMASGHPSHLEDVDVEDNVLTEQTHNTGERSEDEARDDDADEGEETFGGVNHDIEEQVIGASNGIAGDGRNAVRVLDRAGSPWPGGRPDCNSIHHPPPPGRGGSQLGSRGRLESPDSIAKSPFSTIDSRLDSRSTLDGPAGNTTTLEAASPSREELNTFGNKHSLDRQRKGAGGGSRGGAHHRDNADHADPVRRDQVDASVIGAVHRASEDDDEEEEEEEDQPLVEVTLV